MLGTENPLRIVVTGDRGSFSSHVPTELENTGRKLEWISLPVLRFERTPIKAETLELLTQKPMDWILFASPRAVQFWSETLLEAGMDFPVETQVACIGSHTAERASQDGFSTDFYPTEPGTEGFLAEFEDLVSNNSRKPSVFIPMAEGGRTTIRDRLRELGCEVKTEVLYRTLPREDTKNLISQAELGRADLILFTSPSSFDAFSKHFEIPSGARVGALGRYTAEHLKNRGIDDRKILPEGDFSRVGELLC